MALLDVLDGSSAHFFALPRRVLLISCMAWAKDVLVHFHGLVILHTACRLQMLCHVPRLFQQADVLTLSFFHVASLYIHPHPRHTFSSHDLDTLCNCATKVPPDVHMATCIKRQRGPIILNEEKNYHVAARTRPIHTRRRCAKRVSPCEKGVMKKKKTLDRVATLGERNSNRTRLSRVANRKARSAKRATQSDGHQRSERVLRRGLDPSFG